MTMPGTVLDRISYFDDIAQDYESVRGSEIWPSLLHTIRSVDSDTRRVLDVATGTGLFSVRLAEEGFHVLGLDQNPQMLAQAIDKARQQNCSFQGVLGLAEQLPLPDRSISVMFSTNAIHHFDLQAHFTEVKRVLKPDGCYVVYTRFRQQNNRSIWGRLFPHFAEKETRLYNPEDFQRLEAEFPELTLECLDELSFEKPFSCTINGAWTLRLDDVTGSIEVGKSADMIVLNHNLFDIPLTDIHNTEVQQTAFKGNVVYEP